MEREAKLEQKRLEKEARDRERAEQQAREQARRGVEREKARLAKRYPLPDEVGGMFARITILYTPRADISPTDHLQIIYRSFPLDDVDR